MGGRSRNRALSALLSLAVAVSVTGLLLVGAGILAGGAGGVQPLRTSIGPDGTANYRWVTWPFARPTPPATPGTVAPFTPAPSPTVPGSSSCAAPGATACAPAPSDSGSGSGGGNPASGTLGLSLGPAGSGGTFGSTAFFSNPAPFSPGGAEVRRLQLSNTGTLSASYAISVLDGSGLLYSDPVDGLQLSVAHDGATVYSGPLAVTDVPIDLVLAPGQSAAMTLTVWLPTAAGNSFQNLSTTVTFVCTATQVR